MCLGYSYPLSYNRFQMRRVNWTITEKQHKALQKLSRETGLPISELVRRSLDKYFGFVGEEKLQEDEKSWGGR